MEEYISKLKGNLYAAILDEKWKNRVAWNEKRELRIRLYTNMAMSKFEAFHFESFSTFLSMTKISWN